MSNICGPTGIFNLNNVAPNAAESVTLNYLPMGISALDYNTESNWITGLCSRSSAPNITYTNEQNQTIHYYANKLWIVGESNIPNESTCTLHRFSGGNLPNMVTVSSSPSSDSTGNRPTGELIIENFSEDGSRVLYMCFLLIYVGENAPPGGQIDQIFGAIQNNQTEITVDFNHDIFGNIDPNANYLEYKSSQLNSGSEVIVYMNPIRIGSALVNALQNNLAAFDMFNANFTLIPISVPGNWMECEYVPIDSEEVAAYNLPLASGILETQSNQNSLKTILIFIVFAILSAVAYAVVPDGYLFLVDMVIGRDYKTPSEKAQTVFWIDVVLSGIIMITAITLVMVGAFANPAKVANTGTILTAGLTMSILFVLCYIIIQSKKQDEKFLDIPPNMPINL